MKDCKINHRHAHRTKDGRVINHEPAGGYWVPMQFNSGSPLAKARAATVYPIEVDEYKPSIEKTVRDILAGKDG